jgi:hypothetical protein
MADEPQGDLLTADNPPETTQTNWKDSVPREVRFNEDGLDRLSKFTDPHEVAKSYLELESSMGAKVKIPAEDAPPEEVSAFYQKLGRPENPDSYTMPEIPNVNEGIVKAVKEAAYASGSTDKQFESMAKAFAEATAAQQEVIVQESEQTLRKEWGGNYDTFIKTAGRAVTEYDDPDFAEWQKSTGVGNHVPFIKFCKWVAEKTLDDTIVTGTPTKDKEYVPKYPNDPQMYADDDTENGAKAREYFEARGHKYS